jgi:hypothetical protein
MELEQKKEANKENVVSEKSEEQMPVVKPSAPPTSPQPISPSSIHKVLYLGLHLPVTIVTVEFQLLLRWEVLGMSMTFRRRRKYLFYLYADHEPLSFQEVVEEDCWKSTMEE